MTGIVFWKSSWTKGLAGESPITLSAPNQKNTTKSPIRDSGSASLRQTLIIKRSSVYIICHKYIAKNQRDRVPQSGFCVLLWQCWRNESCSHRRLAWCQCSLNCTKEHEECVLESRKYFWDQELKHNNEQSQTKNFEYWHIRVPWEGQYTMRTSIVRQLIAKPPPSSLYTNIQSDFLT